MPSKRFTIFLCLILAGAPLGVQAQGTSGSQFLGVGIGARPMAMGGAVVSLADGGTALYWNPAGLARATGHTVSLTHVSWLSDVEYRYAAYATPLGRTGAIGVAIEGGSASWDNTGEGTFETGDFSGTVGYAWRMKPNLGLAGSFKYLSSTLGSDEASSFAFDAGVMYQMSDAVSFGAATRNLGSAVAYVEDGDPLPATFAVGASYRWRDVLVALDLEKVNDLDLTTRLGLEYYPVDFLALRGGAILGSDSALSSWAGGIGVNWEEQWYLDYAYRPSELGGTHQFALSAGFGTGAGLVPTAASGGEAEVGETLVPKSNITVITELLEELIDEALDGMSLAAASEIYISQVGQHDGSWLVESVLVEELTRRGHVVMTGGMPAGEPQVGEPSRYQISYRIVSGGVTYARVWREWYVGAKKVERRADADIHFQLSDSSNAIVWADQITRQRREIVPGGRIDELATPGQSFASPEVEEGGWDKILEPLVVAAIVGGLIYLFYTSRSTD